MRAVQVKEFGGPEVLVPVELPDPEPEAGEVVIDVAYADTLFVETQVRSGWGREYFDVTPPYVPGGGVSGTVTETGPGVPAEWLGRRVVSHVRGSYASRAVAAVSALTVVPEGVDLLTAAALVHDGVTGAGLIERTEITRGERVLILGASGGMGTLLVQLAAARGARVVGLARGAEKTSLVRELGALTAIDISAGEWVTRAREALGGAADVVLDGVGGELGASALPLTADGGRFSAHGAPSGGFAPVDAQKAADRGIRSFGIGDVQFAAAELGRLAGYALEEAAGGRLRAVIGKVFPLERAREAHTAVERRTVVGKVLLEC
ncbi:zinc-binding dehydrogenase [Streptomyces griseorubiginosus]|uniref:zinc-binding dehydrogenase n=1 Tax=Streptomyces griseorubiginosus TaxID=67304 RepID=UPI001AD6131E|nr:zinc-binding dehydrogenase [Streptomyces griseorubiginosus]MBO4259265.1 zinc-binding dehydrogenase [Streptomyces griseorubiginosus]